MDILRGRRRIVALFVAGSCGLASAACETGAEAPTEQQPSSARSGTTSGASVEPTAEEEAPPAIPAEPGVVVAQPSGLLDGTPFVQQELNAPGDEYATHGSLSIKGEFRPELAVEVKGLRARLRGAK